MEKLKFTGASRHNGGKLRAPLKPLNTLVLWCTEGLQLDTILHKEAISIRKKIHLIGVVFPGKSVQTGKILPRLIRNSKGDFKVPHKSFIPGKVIRNVLHAGKKISEKKTEGLTPLLKQSWGPNDCIRSR